MKPAANGPLRAAPLPANEAERLRELHALDLFNADRIDQTKQVERICRLARDLFDVPAALVTLLDRDRARFVTTPDFKLADIPRSEAICSHTILAEAPLVIPDAHRDERFARNRMVVGAPFLRFYAGTPLQLRDGIRLGTLCLIDTRPRTMSEAELQHLRALADVIADECRARKAAADLRRREALLSQAARMSRIGGWELDVTTGALDLNSEGRRLCGIAGGAPVTVQALLARLQNEQDRARMHDALSSAAAYGRSFDLEAELADGSDARWVRILAEPEIANGRVGRITGAVQDVTERKEAAAQIEHLAYRDSLTGLPNRTQFHERLQNAMATARSSGQRHGLLLFDIDHFKTVNDSMGHYAGDALLAALAARLLPAIAPGHTLARIAGDEFAIIVPGVQGAADLAPIANAVLDLLKQPVAHDGYALALGVSVGGAILPDHGRSASEILKNADIALQRAKAEGRNRFVMFQESMRADIEDRVQLLHDVRVGIARGAFSLLYQPIVSTKAGTINGFEGLMRWNDAERGILLPAIFKAAFEDPDLAILLGETALASAMTQMRQWLDAGIDFGRIAVNLSAPQFHVRDLADRILGMMRQHRIPNRCLSLEITESVYIDARGDDIRATIETLHDAGVAIALDDFGTGYASLSHLSQFPIDRLKIDKSFVQSEARSAVVDAIIHMGRSLGLDVVAEGVETPRQVAALRAKGCDHMQGFVFGRPLAAEAVPGFIHQVGAHGLPSAAFAA